MHVCPSLVSMIRPSLISVIHPGLVSVIHPGLVSVICPSLVISFSVSLGVSVSVGTWDGGWGEEGRDRTKTHFPLITLWANSITGCHPPRHNKQLYTTS